VAELVLRSRLAFACILLPPVELIVLTIGPGCECDWKAATLHVRRVKSGKPAAHPIRGDELRALRDPHRNQEPASPFVFVTERGGPFTTDAVNRLIKRLGESNKRSATIPDRTAPVLS
jgi:hypothetical protein